MIAMDNVMGGFAVSGPVIPTHVKLAVSTSEKTATPYASATRYSLSSAVGFGAAAGAGILGDVVAGEVSAGHFSTKPSQRAHMHDPSARQ